MFVSPEPLADPGATLVVPGGPDRSGVRLGIDPHAAELDDTEDPPALSDPLLAIKNGPPRRGPDEHGRDREQRPQHEQAEQCAHDIEQAFAQPGESPWPGRLERSPSRRQAEQVGRGCQPFIDPVHAHRACAGDLPPPPRRRSAAQGNDQIGRAGARDQLIEPVEPSQDGDRVGLGMDDQLPAASGDIDIAHDRQAIQGRLIQAAGQPSQVAPGADQEEPARLCGRLDAIAPVLRGVCGHGFAPILRCLSRGRSRARGVTDGRSRCATRGRAQASASYLLRRVRVDRPGVPGVQLDPFRTEFPSSSTIDRSELGFQRFWWRESYRLTLNLERSIA